MRVGFTGTRDGMASVQYDAVEALLVELNKDDGISEAHHGCCLGADAEFHFLVKNLEYKVVIIIHAHPANLANLAGWTNFACLRTADVKHPAMAPLKRNRTIVNSTDILVATPKGPEELRSGTWSTVRFAIARKKPVRIVWPDGTVEER